MNEWNNLIQKSDGNVIPDNVVQNTLIYKENKAWIEDVKEKGYDIIDIGNDASGTKSTFYEMEKSTVYTNGTE